MIKDKIMKPVVLIVEDEPPQAELLKYNLERDGFRTVLAVDGEEALLLAEEEAPNLVILGWMLPLLSGIEVCRRLRRQNSSAKMPIIMLTARGVESDRQSLAGVMTCLHRKAGSNRHTHRPAG